ncbi:MAG: GntR family transcriptional regulator [Chloroflexi bacterium]|nr:GntR family transcriptional regulator [Chloroflexota bacterium]
MTFLSALSAIDKSSAVPYYYQLAEILRRQLDSRASRGEVLQLPSENELSEHFVLSRATVRHALDILETEGWIYRQKGKGAFAPFRRVQHELTQLVSTTEDMQRRGWPLETRLLSCELLPSPAYAADALEIGQETAIYRLERLRLVDGEPLSLQISHLPASLCPGLEQHAEAGSLYRLLEERYALKLWNAQEVLRARPVSPYEADLLDVREGACTLYIERVTYNTEGIPVEYLESVWRGDRYDFTVHLTRS